MQKEGVEMKRICCLKGSPRKKGNTNTLTKIVTDRLRNEGVGIDEFTLYDMDIKGCLACRWCQKDWTQVSCIQKDDMQKIYDSIMNSDLLLLSTPIYLWYCTAPMKAALDRTAYALNMYYGGDIGPSLWAGKSAAIISSCGYPVEKGADLFEEGVKRLCKHSRLTYRGMLCERHKNLQLPFMDEEKQEHAEKFADQILGWLGKKGLDKE